MLELLLPDTIERVHIMPVFENEVFLDVTQFIEPRGPYIIPPHDSREKIIESTSWRAAHDAYTRVPSSGLAEYALKGSILCADPMGSNGALLLANLPTLPEEESGLVGIHQLIPGTTIHPRVRFSSQVIRRIANEYADYEFLVDFAKGHDKFSQQQLYDIASGLGRSDLFVGNPGDFD